MTSPVDTLATQPWAEQVARTLQVTEGPIVILVDGAKDKMLGHLVRALIRAAIVPELYISLDELFAHASDNAVALLALSPNEFAAANLRRGQFAAKGLRLLLWIEDAWALRQGAPDLADWISHTVHCPDGPAPFAVRGLQLADRPVVWTDSRHELDLALAALSPLPPVTLDASRPFADLLKQVEDSSAAWILIESDDSFEIGKIRLALAVKKRSTRVVRLRKDKWDRGWKTGLELDAKTDSIAKVPALGGWRPFETLRRSRLATTLADMEFEVTDALSAYRGNPHRLASLPSERWRKWDWPDSVRLRAQTSRKRSLEEDVDDGMIRSFDQAAPLRDPKALAELESALLDVGELSEDQLSVLLSLGYVDVAVALGASEADALWLRASEVAEFTEDSQRVDAWHVVDPTALDAVARLRWLLEMGRTAEALHGASAEPLGDDPRQVLRARAALETGLSGLAVDLAVEARDRVSSLIDDLELLELSALADARSQTAFELVAEASRRRVAMGLGPYHHARGAWVEAEVNLVAGRTLEAVEHAGRALMLLDGLGWGPHPLRARSLLVRGRAHAARAEYTLAASDFSGARDAIVAATGRRDHPLACSARFDLAVAQRSMGKGSEEEVDAARAAVEQIYPFGHPELLRARGGSRSSTTQPRSARDAPPR